MTKTAAREGKAGRDGENLTLWFTGKGSPVLGFPTLRWASTEDGQCQQHVLFSRRPAPLGMPVTELKLPLPRLSGSLRRPAALKNIWLRTQRKRNISEINLHVIPRERSIIFIRRLSHCFFFSLLFFLLFLLWESSLEVLDNTFFFLLFRSVTLSLLIKATLSLHCYDTESHRAIYGDLTTSHTLQLKTATGAGKAWDDRWSLSWLCRQVCECTDAHLHTQDLISPSENFT